MAHRAIGILVACLAALLLCEEATALTLQELAVQGDIVRVAKVAKCTPPMITCREWCRRNPQRTNCMTGHPNSCDRKPQGADTCVQ